MFTLGLAIGACVAGGVAYERARRASQRQSAEYKRHFNDYDQIRKQRDHWQSEASVLQERLDYLGEINEQLATTARSHENRNFCANRNIKMIIEELAIANAQNRRYQECIDTLKDAIEDMSWTGEDDN